jgi:hypothetical protein
MKRLATLMVVGTMAVALTGCGQEAPKPTAQAPAAEPAHAAPAAEAAPAAPAAPAAEPASAAPAQ